MNTARSLRYSASNSRGESGRQESPQAVDVRLPRSAVLQLRRQVLNELRQRSLRLSDKDVIRVWQILDRRRDVWTTEHYVFQMTCSVSQLA